MLIWDTREKLSLQSSQWKNKDLTSNNQNQDCKLTFLNVTFRDGREKKDQRNTRNMRERPEFGTVHIPGKKALKLEFIPTQRIERFMQ